MEIQGKEGKESGGEQGDQDQDEEDLHGKRIEIGPPVDFFHLAAAGQEQQQQKKGQVPDKLRDGLEHAAVREKDDHGVLVVAEGIAAVAHAHGTEAQPAVAGHRQRRDVFQVDVGRIVHDPAVFSDADVAEPLAADFGVDGEQRSLVFVPEDQLGRILHLHHDVADIFGVFEHVDRRHGQVEGPAEELGPHLLHMPERENIFPLHLDVREPVIGGVDDLVVLVDDVDTGGNHLLGCQAVFPDAFQLGARLFLEKFRERLLPGIETVDDFAGHQLGIGILAGKNRPQVGLDKLPLLLAGIEVGQFG